MRVKSRIRQQIGFTIMHRKEDVPWLNRRSHKADARISARREMTATNELLRI
jgi:hypothetical protein